MRQRLLIAALILVSSFFWYTQASADFLGLAPGDYSVTLLNSSTLCGGSNCVGTVHIGASGKTDFDWLFENIGLQTTDFDFSPAGATFAAEANQFPFFDCVMEALVSLSATACGFFSASGLFMELRFDPATSIRIWAGLLSAGAGSFTTAGDWIATRLAVVPEPMTGSLLLFGLGALGLWRRFRAKQD